MFGNEVDNKIGKNENVSTTPFGQPVKSLDLIEENGSFKDWCYDHFKLSISIGISIILVLIGSIWFLTRPNEATETPVSPDNYASTREYPNSNNARQHALVTNKDHNVIPDGFHDK